MDRIVKRVLGISGAGVLLFALGTQAAHAATRGIFSPDGSKAFILIQGVMIGGGADGDPETLFDAIAGGANQVPGGGSGKVIKSEDEALNLSCVQKEGNVAQKVMCNLVIKASTHSTVSASKQLAEYSVSNAEAAVLASKLLRDFTSADGKLKIEARPEEFKVSYHGGR